MSDNPYTPPSAKVADAAATPTPSLPSPVLIAVVLLWVGLAFDVLNWARLVPAMTRAEVSALTLLVGLCVMLLTAVLIWKIMRGRNWARIALLILQIAVIGNLLWSMSVSHSYFYLTGEMLLMLFIRPALFVVALVLLFGPGRAWFAPR